MTYNDYIQKFLAALPNYLGYNKLLSQQNTDQGDGLQRVAQMFTLLFLINDQELINKVAAIHPVYDRTFHLLQLDLGWYVRSSNPQAGWQNEMRRTSRDQLGMAEVAFASCHDTHKLRNVLLAHLERATFHQNYYNGTNYCVPDIITPFEIGTFCRGLLANWSVAFNWFFDIFFAIDLATRSSTPEDNWSSDQILAVNLLFANHKYPNFITRFFMKMYKKTTFMSSVKAYHLDAINNCEPLYWLYRAAYTQLENYNPENV